ncbi:hypothetical protein CK215_30085 [Mesorhizobium sp. WSM3864]|uniref:hypothetical protein n=1 Tax=Mesorhizobium sp. WSM3864 TaxID=2029404 RepID=UPI000BAED864|nr:hypothetical protein [Mesorhizobium sp. WSM3864]PBB88983.1 hypothetical protein CK215_30085 [Mesorhizobium sp. WSM3864]
MPETAIGIRDLPALRDRFGPDVPATEWDLQLKMKCTMCGGKRITLTYSPETSPKDHPRKGRSRPPKMEPPDFS